MEILTKWKCHSVEIGFPILAKEETKAKGAVTNDVIALPFRSQSLLIGINEYITLFR